MQPEERLAALGFGDEDAAVLAAHFRWAEEKGETGHGYSRIAWLETWEELPFGTPKRVGDNRWDGSGALGYLTLHAAVQAELASPPEHARVVVCANTFPTGALGYWVRMLAEGGLVGVLTATSPRRLASPDGGPPLTGTNPLAIGIPSSDGAPVVADVSMGAVTHGAVLAGLAQPDELVPFGGAQAYKAFALAVGLQLLVDSLAGGGYGAVLVVARPEADPVPAFRELAAGVRLPGSPARP